MGMKGNENTNNSAKGAAENSSIRRCVKRFTSMMHINYTITKRKLKEGNHWFEIKKNVRLFREH